jgi:hypothetical protein
MLTALRPTSPIPAAGSVLNPTSARLERDFMRAIHNTEKSRGGNQNQVAKRDAAAEIGSSKGL